MDTLIRMCHDSYLSHSLAVMVMLLLLHTFQTNAFVWAYALLCSPELNMWSYLPHWWHFLLCYSWINTCRSSCAFHWFYTICSVCSHLCACLSGELLQQQSWVHSVSIHLLQLFIVTFLVVYSCLHTLCLSLALASALQFHLLVHASFVCYVFYC